MADAPPPSGPDLAAGVPAADLAEGVPLAGRVGDDAVLLTRIEGRCHAVGATCTHYGAPLAEGMVVGHTVRCPWHHAAFDLRTGAVDRPPALSPLPCWEVEEQGGTVRVAHRVEAPPPPARRARGPASVVIVGAGAAGVAAAETLRDAGYEGPVTILDDDPDAAVDRPNLSKDYLAGNAPEEWVTLRSAAQLAERGITLRRTRVGALDPRGRRVLLADGGEATYEACILATGASPVRLPIPTHEARPLLTLRSLADSRAIIAAADRAPARRAVVIGASFIGLEVAASLTARGIAVHVVAPEARPLERVLGAEVGDWIRGVHEAKGVTFHLERKPVATEADGVRLDDGTLLRADFVVAGVGVRPNLGLAEGAGLALDRGVVVDERLVTSAPGVWAVGDIARWPDPHTGAAIRVEHWVVAERQARAAARDVLGDGARFDAVPFFWSAHHDAVLQYVGHAERWDRVEVDGDLAAGDAEVRYVDGGRALATVTVGRDRAGLAAERRMEAALG
ncbi:FAD-dependent oxidoreductase [Roseisolibacter sp. H3M3-2]|uniref:FAD-dependent oxidoreductase n=1 Tax=Roseisolibacter sp. H3M3-2 TaxID=3031323 RepID=UPI0023DBFE7D|nr:FAD-dependent oxidoreductase [Roseisolibacter sp. H3M3-2]MDF1505328.1 FAD-dependent oxidoreductase [Roseisolibacter sp. H3M3-2]